MIGKKRKVHAEICADFFIYSGGYIRRLFFARRNVCGGARNTFINMGKYGRIKRAVACTLLLAAMLSVLFVVCPPQKSEDGGAVSPYEGILRVWQLDGVEGGQGSRASFLARAAASFEERHDGLFVLVTAHTRESAENAVRQGNLPDVISFGGSCGFVADLAKPLYDLSWAASQVGGNTFAYPWCRGGYFLFTAEGDFSDVTAENTVLSDAKNTNVYAAAYCEGMEGNFAFEPSEKAYVSLLNGKYKYMLGTQRDVWRFRTRNFSVRTQALYGYSDIWQYAAVCAEDGAMRSAAEDFLRFLLSDNVQAGLVRIGMMSVSQEIYGADIEAMDRAENGFPEKKPRAWLSEDAFDKFRQEAEAAVKGDKSGAKNLQNYLV